jgi:hypothetical protein
VCVFVCVRARERVYVCVFMCVCLCEALCLRLFLLRLFVLFFSLLVVYRRAFTFTGTVRHSLLTYVDLAHFEAMLNGLLSPHITSIKTS